MDYSEFKEKIKKDSLDTKESLFAKLIMRRLSSRVSWILINFFGVTNPNLITLIGFIIGLSGIFFILLGRDILLLLGVVLLIIWRVSDHMDGEIARFTENKSLRGRFLDNVADQTMFGLILATSTIWVFKNIPNLYVLLIGFSSTVFFLLNRLLTGLRAENVLKNGFDEYNSPKKDLKDMANKSGLLERIGIKVGKLYLHLIAGEHIVIFFSFALISDSYILTNYIPFLLFGFEMNLTLIVLIIYISMVPFYVMLLYGYYIDLYEKEN